MSIVLELNIFQKKLKLFWQKKYLRNFYRTQSWNSICVGLHVKAWLILLVHFQQTTLKIMIK